MFDRAGIHLYLGDRGSGKSRLMRHVAREAASRNRIVLVHDIMGDWLKWGPYPDSIIVRADLNAENMAKLAIANAPCTLVYDEIRDALPLGGGGSPTALDIVTYGRHYNVTLMGSTQRPALVNNSLRALITQAFVFHMKIKSDLKWLEDNLSPDLATAVPNLKPGEFIHWP